MDLGFVRYVTNAAQASNGLLVIWLAESCMQAWREAFWLLKRLITWIYALLMSLFPFPLQSFGCFHSFWKAILILLLCKMRNYNSVGGVSCLLFIGVQEMSNFGFCSPALLSGFCYPTESICRVEADCIGVHCTITTSWSLSQHCLFSSSQCSWAVCSSQWPVLCLRQLRPQKLGAFSAVSPLSEAEH